jgi:hypothetical protein
VQAAELQHDGTLNAAIEAAERSVHLTPEGGADGTPAAELAAKLRAFRARTTLQLHLPRPKIRL